MEKATSRRGDAPLTIALLDEILHRHQCVGQRRAHTAWLAGGGQLPSRLRRRNTCGPVLRRRSLPPDLGFSFEGPEQNTYRYDLITYQTKIFRRVHESQQSKFRLGRNLGAISTLSGISGDAYSATAQDAEGGQAC